jgi:hypothetical protein
MGRSPDIIGRFEDVMGGGQRSWQGSDISRKVRTIKVGEGRDSIIDTTYGTGKCLVI